MPELLTAASPGFAPGDAYALGMVFAGLALFAAVGALSHQGQRPFSAAIVYLVLGAGLSIGLYLLGTDMVDPFRDAEVIERLAEFAVIVALFAAGLKLDRPLDHRAWRSAILLLGLVMPLTIAAVAGLSVLLIGLSAGAAVALAAALAPTDPVLASDVQVGPPGEADEPEPRFALTAEAGFNDGLAFPFVFLGIFLASESGSGWVLEWVLADLVYAVVVGVAIGALAGRGIAWLVSRLHARGLLAPSLDGWLAIATVVAIYGLTEAVGAYGFLAAFTSGLGFRRHERDHQFHGRVHSGAETVEKFTELALVLLLGSTVTLTGLSTPGVGGWAVILLLLLVVRPLVTVLAYSASPVPRAERWFIGWFGIRGIGSFYYVSVVIGADVLSRSEAELVYWTTIACVGVSIVAHGLTATPLARRLGLEAP